MNADQARLLMPRNSFERASSEINSCIENAAREDKGKIDAPGWIVDQLDRLQDVPTTITGLGEKIRRHYELKGFRVCLCVGADKKSFNLEIRWAWD